MSALATCGRLVADDPPYACGEPLLLYISASPMARFDSLVVMRCPICGYDTVQGVLHEPIAAEGV